MEELIAARFNVYWYLSFVAPAVVMLIFTFSRTKKLLILGVIISLIATYTLSNIAVQEKWKVRNQVAQTDIEREHATADGANLIFTAFFIGPFEAIIYTSIWGVLGWRLWPRVRRKWLVKFET
jgi:uncharacterized membrane protein YiaA